MRRRATPGWLPPVMAAIGWCCSGESPTETEQLTLAERLQTAVDSALLAHGGTGISAAALIPGHSTWTGAGGISHGSQPITPSMLFGVTSITKNHTAALILQVVEQGHLTLEDSISRWLPPMANVDATITIRQLLSHTSGVFDFVDDPTFWPTIFSDPARNWDPEEVIASFVKAPYFAPGSGTQYSNTGYLLLGMIVEETTGSTVSNEFRNRLWRPTGLNRTYFDVEEVVSGEIAHAWNHLDGDGILDDLCTLPRTSSSSAVWTAGVVFFTAEDLAKWTQSLFRGDVLAEPSLKEMLSFGPSGYGLGTDSFGPEHFGAAAVGHVGSGAGYSGVMVYLEDYDTSVAVLMNDNNLDCLFATVSALVTEIRVELDS